MITREYAPLDRSNEAMLYALGIWTATDIGEIDTTEDEDGTWRTIGEIRYYPTMDGLMDRRPRVGITEDERSILRGAAAELYRHTPTVDEQWELRTPKNHMWHLSTEIRVRVED